MTLITAHKILIALAVALFALFGVWEIAGSATAGSPWRGAVGAASLVAAVAFGAYFRTIERRYG